MMRPVAVSLLFTLLSVALGANESTNTSEQPSHGMGAMAEAPDSASIEEGHAELHAANAVLFLFFALVFGIVLRRAMTGFIIPYTGLLVVRSDVFLNNKP
jgi:hypothetical protein